MAIFLCCELFSLGDNLRCEIDANYGALGDIFGKSRGDTARAATQVQDVEVGLETRKEKSRFVLSRARGMVGGD